MFKVHRPFGQGGSGILALTHGRGACMAGGACDFTDVPATSIDGGDDTQRHIDAVQHRALFYVYFNKTQVAGRIAFKR